MNSALQALLHTPPLIAFLSHMSHIPLDSIRQRLIADFSILLQKVWSGHYSLVAPGDLLRDIVFINPFFRGYGQHDAQELIRCVLDQMHEGLKRCEEYEYTRYAYGEGSGEEQEVRWRERELQKEKEKLMEKVRGERRGKKGSKETDKERKKRERDHPTANGHRHTASVSANSSTPSSSAPPTPTAAAAAEHSTTSISTASTTSSISAASSNSSTSSAPSTSAPSASPSSSNSSSHSAETSAKKPVKIWPDHSIISDIFSGYLQSRIRCHQCSTISTVYDQFYDLSLEIPKESNMKRIAAERGTEAMTPQTKQSWLGSLLTYTGLVPPPLSLETCLHAFCTSDRLIDRDQYRCDQCKAKVDASKTLALHSLPEVLMLHVKRFAHNSYFGSKVTRHVNFPINGLDMRPFLSEDKRARMAKAADAAAAGTASAATADDSSLYDLYAIVRHLGSVAGGHYISYAKNHVTGKWYEFDDRIVTEISEKKLAEVEAYVLFYRHRHSDSQRKQLLDRIQDATLTQTQNQPAPTRFISRQYVKKVSVLGRVEPIDNRDLLCVHGVPYELPADGGQLAVPVSKAGWDRLVKQYGGGPLVDGGRYECEQCLIPIIRARERKRISALDNEATHHSLPTDPFYLIHDDWLRQWRAFIQEKGARPGPITNQQLLDKEGRPRPGLVKVRDYRGLHGTVWEELLRCYGGGPVIVRKRLDIYEEEGALADEQQQSEERKEEKQQKQQQQSESKQVRTTRRQQNGDEDMAAAEDGDGVGDEADEVVADEEGDEEGDETQMIVSFHTSEQPTSPSPRSKQSQQQQAASHGGTAVDVQMEDKMEEEIKQPIDNTASTTLHQHQQPSATISMSGDGGA